MKNFPRHLTKIILLLVLSLGLFFFSEEFSPASIFERQSTGWVLWISYAKDLIQPSAVYFFVCLGERWLRTWQARAFLAFTILTLVEFGQDLYYRVASGHYVGTFDPIDILMYAIGVVFAVIVEQQVLVKMLSPGNEGLL